MTQRNNCDVEADTGQMSTGVEIQLPMSHNVLTIVEEYVQFDPHTFRVPKDATGKFLVKASNDKVPGLPWPNRRG